MEKFEASSWSSTIGQLAYDNGDSRLIIVSSGNTDPGDYTQICESYPDHNLAAKLQDPSQSLNALTVGAFTKKTLIPPGPTHKNYEIVAGEGNISPHTTSGFLKKPIKPEIVLEGGNMAFDGTMPISDEATFTLTSLNNDFTSDYFRRTWGTSSATASASQLSALIWNEYPDLRAETIKGLIVHSTSYTDAMMKSFPRREDRLSICGYGVPDLDLALNSMDDNATIVIEDSIQNGQNYRDANNRKKVRRFAKFFKLPVPEDQLLNLEGDPNVELRITLSYNMEPSHYRRKTYNGLDLKWDIQGPQENVMEFKTRINKILRDEGNEHRDDGKFRGWEISSQARSRGTVQADRWIGPASYLAGDKYVSIMPNLGWWDRRRDFVEKSLNFTLIVSVKVPGEPIYEVIKTSIESEVEIENNTVDIEIETE